MAKIDSRSAKKIGKIRICVDYRKLNVVTITYAFPLPFTDNVLDAVARHDMYSFLDDFSGYSQVRMYLDDQEKTTFVTNWGVYVRGRHDVRVKDDTTWE